MIPKAFIDDLIHRADIVSVIGHRIPLKKAGTTYKACCPFHQEKTPSFHVNPIKQFYHCFGCGAHGNALGFIIEHDHLDFVSAIETLAHELGVTVPRESHSQNEHTQKAYQQAKQRKTTALELLNQVANWFTSQLKHQPAKTAVEYLQHRGLSGEIARHFMIGFAPASKTALQQAFPNIDTETWLQVGLVTERDGHIIDKFRDRVIFPIRDLRGQVIAFGGRIIKPSEYAPKYLNSPETEFFHKSQTIYGLYELLSQNRNPTSILLVEGYMDVVALAQLGISYATATLGTATTEQHITLLFRHTPLIIFAFDGDRAGREAAQKALSVALPLLTGDRAIRFFFLPDQEDPDSFVRRVGAQAFLAQVEQHALSQGKFLVQLLAQNHQLNWRTADDARRLLAGSLEWVKSCQDISVRYGLIQEMAQAADMQEWQVERALGIKTGMAVHRKPETSATGTSKGWYGFRQERPTDPPLHAPPSLAQTLLRLLSAYPSLANQWPMTDERLIGLLPQTEVKTLLIAVKSSDATSASILSSDAELPSAPVWIDLPSAQQEWQDGWRQLLCQALQFVREESLKRLDNTNHQEAIVAQIRTLSQRWRKECRKLDN